MSEVAQFALSCFKNIMKTPYEAINTIGDTILVPRFTENVVLSIIDQALELFKAGKPVVKVEGDVCVVGDIHGNFYDLIRIFTKNGYPPKTTYVFLGDYVDRGDMSLEVILFLYILKINYPDKIILIRGNHEFMAVNKCYGFFDSVVKEFSSDKVWHHFNASFEYLPLCCIINKNIFCVHGGISEHLQSIDNISALKFPIVHSELVNDLTWSDPTSKHSNFMTNQRGKGCVFGPVALAHFLKNTKMSMLIRSHECVDGYKYSFGESLLTVFSSSCYTTCKNRAGYCMISKDSRVVPVRLEPFNQPRIDDVVFYPAQNYPCQNNGAKFHLDSCQYRKLCCSSVFTNPNFSLPKFKSHTPPRMRSIKSISHFNFIGQ